MADRDRERDRDESIPERLHVARERAFFVAQIYRHFRLVGVSLSTGMVWYEYSESADASKWKLRASGHQRAYGDHLGRRGKEYDGKLSVDGKTGALWGFHSDTSYSMPLGPCAGSDGGAQPGVFRITPLICAVGVSLYSGASAILSTHDGDARLVVWLSEDNRFDTELVASSADGTIKLVPTGSNEQVGAWQPIVGAKINYDERYLLYAPNKIVWSVHIDEGVEVGMHWQRGNSERAQFSKLRGVFASLSAHALGTLRFQVIRDDRLALWCQPERSGAWYVATCAMYEANIAVHYFYVQPVGDQRFHSAVVDNHMNTLVVDIETFSFPTSDTLCKSTRTLGEVPLPYFGDE